MEKENAYHSGFLSQLVPIKWTTLCVISIGFGSQNKMLCNYKAMEFYSDLFRMSLSQWIPPYFSLKIFSLVRESLILLGEKKHLSYRDNHRLIECLLPGQISLNLIKLLSWWCCATFPGV